MPRFLGVLAMSAWMVMPAFAMEPPTASDATASNTSSASTSTAATTATTTKVTAGDDEAAAQLKRFKAAGYKPEVHNGVVVFCRNETVMGSRFEKKVCTTAHLLEQQMAAAQNTVSTAQRNLTHIPRQN